jgi:rhodanese-related sulfurtransferase
MVHVNCSGSSISDGTGGKGRKEMKTITKEELKAGLETGDLTLIEVLKPEQFKKEHIEGAVNIPLGQVVTEANDRYDKTQKIVVYCSDSDCAASPTAAKKLEDAGFSNVYDFEGGKKEWKDAGFPMA